MMARNLVKARCELAIGADLTADPLTWQWSDMADPANRPEGTTGRLFDDGRLTLRAGRSGEGSAVTPAHGDLELDNSDGHLTPDNPGSPWWPSVDVDLPVRVSLGAGSRFLRGLGTTVAAMTPDDPDLDVTSDITIRCLLVYSGSPPQAAFLAPRRYEQAGDERGWLPFIGTDGRLVLQWTTDGTIGTARAIVSEKPIPHPGIVAVEIRLDVNNGAGGCTGSFAVAYSHDALDLPDTDWTPLGDPVTSPGTTSIHNPDVGLYGPQVCPFPVYAGRVYDGLGSGAPLLSSFDVRGVDAGAGSFEAATGEVWTITGGEVTDWRPRLTASASSIEPAQPHGKVSGTQRVAISADGELRRLQAGEKPLESALTRLVNATGNSDIVVADWPHEDGRNATVVASSTPGVDAMTLKNSFNLAADPNLPGHAPVLTVAGGQNLYRQADLPAIPQVPGVVWEIAQFLWIDDPAVSPATTQVMAVDTNGRVATWRVTINDTQLAVTGLDADDGGVVLATVPSDPRWYGTMAIVVLRVADDGTDVDWTVGIIPVPLGLLFNTSGTFSGNTGVGVRFRNSVTGPPSGISLGHLVYTAGTNLANGISWLAPADTGFTGERAGRRALRLAAEEGRHLAFIGDPDDTARMGPQGVATWSDLMRECADVDGGLFFDGGPLGETFRTRVSMLNQPVGLVLDGDDPLRPLAGLRPAKDDRRRRTHMVVARPDGAEATVVREDFDPTSKRIFDEQQTANVASDLDLPDQAGWRLHIAGGDRMRQPQITADLFKAMADPDQRLVDEWLALMPGSRIRVDNPGVGHPPGPIHALVDGWSEQVGSAQWAATIAAVPADPWTVAVWDDEDLGRYDTAGSVLDAEFDAGVDTTMDVDTTVGPLWETDSGELPFDVEVGGVVVTVTAIGAPSGTVQTFTVDTDVSLAKTVPAGSDVRLAQPSIRSL